MPFDFSKVTVSKPSSRPTDPIALFQSLRVSDPAVNDLWLAQGDALRQWDATRMSEDIAIVLNTGAGKTLVGLLAAQSIVNETGGHVIYACSSVQLVRQTADKARGYGLPYTTYSDRAFSNELYSQGAAPCITTYHALFNGRSRFSKQDIAALVFDDAHTAANLLRDQFTLRVTREALPETFSQVVQLYRSYHRSVGQELGYLDTYDRKDTGSSWFVPPFVVHQQLAELQRILREASLSENTSTMFAWPYLRDHLEHCAVFVSGLEISFTPPVVPVLSLPYFRKGIRRVYLSATMAAQDAFIRAFGRSPDQVLAPSTTAGECERLILIPSALRARTKKQSDVTIAQSIVKDHKSLVLVPTRRRASAWKGVAKDYKDDVPEQVEQFKQDRPPACLVLTARYDGVDLPGDTCRVLVIDDLPTGLGALERFLWERLGVLSLLRTTVASRVVQSFGRISRGMSDHGVVVLIGDRLIEWILAPKNQAALPHFLRRQIQIGLQVSLQAEAAQDLVDAAKLCLSRDAGWLSLYKASMESLDSSESPAIDHKTIVSMAKDEVAFGEAFWARDYNVAAKALERDLERTFEVSRPTGAWHALWLGYVYELLGDRDRATALYARAHGSERNIPPAEVRDSIEGQAAYTPQIAAVVDLLSRTNGPHLETPKRLGIDLDPLSAGGSVGQVEAALASLGTYLGLESSRPDHEVRSGPDVLWHLPGTPALSMEAKTDKGAGAVYRKDDLGQLRDHRQWVREQIGSTDISSAFVGPVAPSSKDANPDPDMVVIELSEFSALRDRLEAALADICATAIPITAHMRVQEVFAERGLLWPELYEGLAKHRLRDLS